MGEASIAKRRSSSKSTTDPADATSRQALAGTILNNVDGFVERLFAATDDGNPPTPEEVTTTHALSLMLAPLVLIERRSPTDRELELFATLCTSALRRGVPLQAFARRLQAMLHESVTFLNEQARDLGIGPSVVLDVTLDLIDLWHAGFSVLAASATAVAVDDARSDEHRRSLLLHHVLLGTPTREHLVALGLRSGEQYLPLRARPRQDHQLGDLERALVRSQRDGGVCALAVFNGDLAGVVACRPLLDDEPAIDAAIGIGPAALPHELTDAFVIATRALETAFAFGRTGVVTLEELGLRAPILAEQHLGQRLVERYLAPLDADPVFGDTLRDTIAAWFEHGMRMEETARTLHVHVNSLRHRLRRYEEVTGVDLKATEARLELFWALQSEAARRASR